MTDPYKYPLRNPQPALNQNPRVVNSNHRGDPNDLLSTAASRSGLDLQYNRQPENSSHKSYQQPDSHVIRETIRPESYYPYSGDVRATDYEKNPRENLMTKSKYEATNYPTAPGLDNVRLTPATDKQTQERLDYLRDFHSNELMKPFIGGIDSPLKNSPNAFDSYNQNPEEDLYKKIPGLTHFINQKYPTIPGIPNYGNSCYM